MPHLIDFQHAEEAQRWRAINDDVMGGLSRSSLHGEDGIGVFSGELSLEHGGGFASVRREPEPFDLSAYAGLVLQVCGDGRRLEDAPPLDPEAIQQVGLLIADRRPGPFRLEVAWLKTMTSETTP